MKNNIDSIQSQNNTLPSSSHGNFDKRKLIVIFWLIGAILGAFQAWDARHHMSSDGMSYLDMADAYMRGDWKMAVNGFWSPLYSWLLGLGMLILNPSPYNEFTVVHIVNFIIYLCTLGCFHFFILQLINYHRSQTDKDLKRGTVTFSEMSWIAIGYSLFLQSSLNLIGIWEESPDMCVAAFVYLTSGILLRIRKGTTDYLTYALLGVSLGFGYLAKAVMFPLAFIFLSMSMFSIGNLRKALPRAMIALIAFLTIASPFLIALSNAKGRITFGDAGKYNYWYHVNSYRNYYWDGDPPGSGMPKHPVRKIFDMPAIYEYGTPIGGTYPLWYDPSYWNDGIEIHIDLKEQFKRIKTSIKQYFILFYPRYSVLIYSSLLLCLMGRRKWLVARDVAEHWILLVPAIAVLAMYSIVAVDYRYIGPFLPLIWLGVISGIRLPDSEDSRRLLRHMTVVMVLVMIMVTGRHLISVESPSSHVQWQVADALNQMGVLPGDKVVSIGYSHSHFWARLARVRIVAEIPHIETENFWGADSSVKSRVIETFGRTGAKVIVTKRAPGHISPVGWERIANTDYYAYMLPK